MFIGSHAGSGSGRNTRYNSSGCGSRVGERHLNRCYVRRKKEFTTVAIVMLWFVMFRSG